MLPPPLAHNEAERIVTTDATGVIRSINRSTARMFDCTSAELTGQSITNLISDLALMDNRIQIGTQLHTGTRKDGSRFDLGIHISDMQRSSGNEHIAILRNVTQQREVERMKNEFISIVSHELRTPLTSISGALGLLKSGQITTATGQGQQLIDIAHRNCDRLVRLVSDLLDLEKAQSFKLALNRITQPLRPLIQQAVDANRAFAANFGATLECVDISPEITAHVDADRLIQIMTNLLSNAAKFSPQGGKVTVSLHNDIDTVRIDIRDQGPGIPKEFKNRVFEKFSQADGTASRAKGGTGLGLSITKTLVELHGGSIGVESNPAGDICFYFELPKTG